MLTIYGIHRSRASRNIWLALEMDLPFKLEPVVQSHYVANPSDPASRLNSKHPAYLAINPNGKIPAMDDDGLVLFESLAINLHLAKKHGGPLAPANANEDSLASMWSLWAMAEVEPHSLALMFHKVMKPEAERDPKIVASSIEALRAPLAALDKSLAKTGWLIGDRFTVADLNVAEVVRYAMVEQPLIDSVPNVKSWLAACHARPSFIEMMRRRDAEVV